MEIKYWLYPNPERSKILKIVKAIFDSSKKDDILRFLHKELDLEDKFSEHILFNPNKWYIETERPESHEIEYVRKPQRHYRHKKYKTLLINESYVFYPRSKELVMAIFKERFKSGYVSDNLCYIHHSENN